VLPSLLGASVGALIFSLDHGDSPGSALGFWLLWMESSVLGSVGMLPLGLAMLAWGRRAMWHMACQLEWLVWVLLSGGISLLVLIYLPYPFVYLGLPLAAAAVRLGFLPLTWVVWWQAQILGTVLASRLFAAPPFTAQWQQVLVYLPAVAALLTPLLLGAVTEQVRRKTEAHARSELRYRALYERTPSMMYSFSPDGRLLSASRLWLERMGYRADEVIGHHAIDFLDADSRRRAWAQLLPELGHSGQCRDVEYRMLTKTGQPVDVLLSATSERDEDGQITRVLVVLEDVTRKRLAEQLAAEHVRSRVTLESIADGVVRTDAGGGIEYLNPVAIEMTGWSTAEAQGRPYGDVVPRCGLQNGQVLPDPVPAMLREGSQALAPRQLMLRRRDGRELPVQESVAPMRDDAGQLIGAVAVLQDVSVAHQMAVEMAHRAHHDALTGLPNRVLFMDRLRQQLQLAQRTGSRVAVMYLDLDHFKHINDQYGHAGGDSLLQEVAHRLVGSLRASDTACRQGGDEFVVLLPKLDHPSDAGEVAAHLLSRVAQPFELLGQPVLVTFSIGIAVYPADGQDDVSLLRHADEAMYLAKRAGRNRYAFHSGAIT
jgi:diguanylate cyclase (GGDEF)-like protein/PAS domain S-box-containing protein